MRPRLPTPLIALGLGITLGLGLTACGPATDDEPTGTAAPDTMRGELGGAMHPDFARADTPRAFEFPADHGPHPDFRNEWWYLVGNLEDETGRRHGFQVTFFRIALAPGEEARESAWATRQIWMAHLALTDAEAGEHHQAERFAREGRIGLAGAEADGTRIWLEDWVLGRDAQGNWRLTADAGDFALALDFIPERAPVLHGDGGLSRKSAETGNASYYYSKPRLGTAGTIRIGETQRRVEGQSWLDREWSTSVLGEDQAGWDWFALQLADGTNIMIYEMRRFDGERSDFSYAAVMHPDGAVERMGPDRFSIEIVDRWSSPRGGTYPSRWRLNLEPVAAELEVIPVLADQEFTGTVRYWEGAVDVRRQGEDAGRGYVELSGYAAGE